MQNALQHFEFQGRSVALLTFKDRPAWVARDIGRAMEYGEDGKWFVTLLSGDWSDDFTPGVDFEKLTDEALRDFNADAARGTDGVPLGRGSLVILYEPGLHKALLLSRQPRARAMRRWLAEEVMPQLARDGRYSPERQVEQTTGALVPAAPAPVQVAVDLSPLASVIGTLADLQRETLRLLADVRERLDRPALAPVEVVRVEAPVPREGAAVSGERAPEHDADPFYTWLTSQAQPFTLTQAGHILVGERRRLTAEEYNEARRRLVVEGLERASTFVKGKWRHRWWWPQAPAAQ